MHANKLINFTVLYRIESLMTPLCAPFGFQCCAEDVDHAEEQCLNAYPSAGIVWAQNADYSAALADYYFLAEEN